MAVSDLSARVLLLAAAAVLIAGLVARENTPASRHPAVQQSHVQVMSDVGILGAGSPLIGPNLVGTTRQRPAREPR